MVVIAYIYYGMEVVCNVTPYKRRGKKRKIFKRKGLIILSVLLFIFALVVVYLNVSVNPIVRKVSEEKVRGNIRTIVNDTSEEILSDRYSYSDFIDISRDADGSITLVQVNSMLINVISRSIANISQEKLNEMTKAGVEVPLGAFSGITIFAGAGTEVNVSVMPLGVVSSNIVSEFLSEGINQTVHRIYLNVLADVKLILPGVDYSVQTVTKVIISESVIVGKIPELFLTNSSLFGN